MILSITKQMLIKKRYVVPILILALSIIGVLAVSQNNRVFAANASSTLPDFVITGAKLKYYKTGYYSVVTVKNIGNYDYVGSSTIQVNIFQQGVSTSTAMTQGQLASSLAKRESKDILVGPMSLKTGTNLKATIAVNPTNTIPESNTNNNSYQFNAIIPRPDFVISDIRIAYEPETLSPGQDPASAYYTYVTIVNKGDGVNANINGDDSDDLRVIVRYVDKNGRKSSSGLSVRAPDYYLAKGYTKVIRTGFGIAIVPAGNITATAYIDSLQDPYAVSHFVESNEKNNTLTKSFIIPAVLGNKIYKK